MKVAIVHDYLNQQGGAERVVEALHHVFPDAPIYTLFYETSQLLPGMEGANIIPSFVQKFKFIRRHFKLFFWLYPFAIRTLKIEGFDVVLSSSSAYGKGVTLAVGPTGDVPLHICYCHTPMRFAWNFDEYIKYETSQGALRKVAAWFVPFLKRWDIRTSYNVNKFIANSSTVGKRISDCYERDSIVIFPPVHIPSEPMFRKPSGYFLVVSRLVSYKRIDLAVQVCTEAALPLVVIGDGPDRPRLEAMAGPTIAFLGYQPDNVKYEYMAHCIALIFPGEEDFGITPLEVNGLGRPVVAFKAGGALDTVRDGLNGIFFATQSAGELNEALYEASQKSWDPYVIREWALQFGREVFESRIVEVLERESNATRNR